MFGFSKSEKKLDSLKKELSKAESDLSEFKRFYAGDNYENYSEYLYYLSEIQRIKDEIKDL